MASQFGKWKIPPRTLIRAGGVVGITEDWPTEEYGDEESEYDVLGNKHQNETSAEVRLRG